MNQITDRSTLREAVQAFAHTRKTIEESWPVIVQLAEAHMNQDARIKDIEQSVHGTVDSPLIGIPDDLAQLQRVVLTVAGGEESHITFQPPSATDFKTSQTGTPRTAHVADQAIVLTPSPAIGSDYTVYYIPKFLPLSEPTSTNYILTEYPDIYLNACMMIVGLLQKDAKTKSTYEREYINSVRRANARSIARHFPEDQPMRVRTRRGVRR